MGQLPQPYQSRSFRNAGDFSLASIFTQPDDEWSSSDAVNDHDSPLMLVILFTSV